MTRLGFLAIALSLTLAAGTPAPVQADRYEALRADATLEAGLLTLSIAEGIRRYCPTISPRWIRAYGYMRGLVRRAEGMGYSRDEIEEYVDDQAEVDRVVGYAEAWFGARGVSYESDAESYCAVGRDEINAGTEIGRLLR